MSEKGKTIASALADLGRTAVSEAVGLLQRGLHVEHLGSPVPDLLYARGFLLCREEHAPEAVTGWEARDVGGWTLHTDPRVPVDHATCEDREAWVVGDAFHPDRGVFKQMAQ